MKRLFVLTPIAAALVIQATVFAWAQGFSLNNLLAGVPTGPVIASAVDELSGLYFGTNRVGFAGHMESGQKASGNTPALSSCGTGTLAAGSTDTAGEFTATGATGCTLTFGTAYAAAPSCSVTEETVNTATTTKTVTASTIVVASGGSGSKYSYLCLAKSGG